MLSTDTLKIYDLLFQFATMTKFMPFDWDDSRSILKLIPPSTRRRRFMAYLVTALDLVLTAGLAAGYLHYALVYQMPSRIIPPFVATLATVWGSIFAATGYTLRSETLVLVNKLFQINRHLVAYFDAEKKYDRGLYLICQIYLVVNASAAGLVFLYFLRPRAHDNLYEFYGGTSILGKSTFALVMASVVCAKYVVMTFFVFLMFFCGVLLDVWMKLMIEYVEAGRMTCDEAVSMYNSTRICQRLFQNFIGPVVLPGMIFMASGMLVVDVSGLIMFHLEMSPLVTITLANIATVLSVVLTFGFRLLRASNKRSREFLALIAIKSGNDGNVSRRLKGCRRIQIRIGSFFVSQDATILTIFSLISDNIASLVIAYRE